MMSATILSSSSCNLIRSSGKQIPSHPKPFLGDGQRILNQLVAKRNPSYHAFQNKKLPHRFSVFAVTEGSAKSSESEETIPSWAKPDSDEPPPWATDEGKGLTSQGSFEIPFYVYLLTSTITAIAAVSFLHLILFWSFRLSLVNKYEILSNFETCDCRLVRFLSM